MYVYNGFYFKLLLPHNNCYIAIFGRTVSDFWKSQQDFNNG